MNADEKKTIQDRLARCDDLEKRISKLNELYVLLTSHMGRSIVVCDRDSERQLWYGENGDVLAAVSLQLKALKEELAKV